MKLKELYIDVVRCDIEIATKQEEKNRTLIPPGIDANMHDGILRIRENENSNHPRLIRLYLDPIEMDEVFPKVVVHQSAGNFVLQAEAISYLEVKKQVGKCKIVKTSIEQGELFLSRCSLRIRECYGDFLKLQLSKCNCYLAKSYFHDLLLQAHEAKLAGTLNRGVMWKLQQTGKKPIYLERLDVKQVIMEASACELSQLKSEGVQIKCQKNVILDQLEVGCCQVASTQGDVDIDMSDSAITELTIVADRNIYYRLEDLDPLYPKTQDQGPLLAHDRQPKVLSLVSNKGIISL